MTLFVATLAVFVIAMLAMAVGTLLGRTRIQGSCGGVGGRCDGNGEPSCDFCQPQREPGEARG